MRDDINCRNWFGYATIENIAQIAEAIRTFLTIDGKPRYYTFMALNETRSTVTDLDTSRKVRELNDGKVDMLLSYWDANNNRTPDVKNARWAKISIHDNSHFWGIDANGHDGDSWEDHDKNNSHYVDFRDNRLEVRIRNGFGEQLIWRIVPERHEGEPYWENGKSYRFGE